MKGKVFMKKLYEAPIIEKVEFVSDEKVCGLFNDIFGVDVVSGDNTFTEGSIFQWEELENAENGNKSAIK